MADLTRRKFLSRGSVTAVGAIGAMTVGSGTVAAAAAAVTNAGDALETEDLGALEGPLFVHVRDAATGEVEVMVDEKSVVFNDQTLVNKLRRAAK
jgi:tetrahydromethanopterin S-methyltransferase subunit C